MQGCAFGICVDFYPFERRDRVKRVAEGSDLLDR
jgi:hypothetical protein